jgi:uncharacterized membrane protein
LKLFARHSREGGDDGIIMFSRLVKSPAHLVAVIGWCHLIVLSLLWELLLDPSRPAWLWAAIKVVPLALALPGVITGKNYTLQWASMLVLLYMAEGCVRGMSGVGITQLLGWAEFALAWATFFGIVLHLRPAKKQAVLEKKAREAAEKADAR